MRSWFSIGGLVVAVGATQPSLAAPALVSGLDYVVAEGCPDRAAFLMQLAERSRALSDPSWHGGAFDIQVSISRVDAGYSGQVRWIDATGSSNERAIAGPRCSEVALALALAAAVSIDGLASTSAETVPATHQQKPAKPQQPSASPEANRRVVSPSHLVVGPVLGAHTGIAPTLAPTLGAGIEYRNRVALGGGAFDSGALRLEGLYGWAPWREVDVRGSNYGQARFEWLAGRVSGCAWRSVSPAVSFGACALVELGGLQGNGRTSLGERHDSGWWVAPGADLDASIRTGPLWWRLTLGAVRPIVRDRFRFSVEPQVFRPPSLGIIAAFELAWAIF